MMEQLCHLPRRHRTDVRWIDPAVRTNQSGM